MGGGLGFLNKKTWHPGRMSNQERLWKAEEDAAAEQRSLAELRKKIEDERGREELREAAIAGGHQKAADRLDWMYQGGMTAKMEADKRNEDAMLGQAPIQPQTEEQEVTRLEQATLLPTFYAEDTPAAANETWARLHSDPLFAIRQQEQSARKQVVANPVQMAAIKQQVATLKEAALAKKLAKREAKEANKAKKAAKKAGKQQKDPPLRHVDASNGHADGSRLHRSEHEPAPKRQRRSRSPVDRHHRHREDAAHRDRPMHSTGAEQDSSHRHANRDSSRHGHRDEPRHHSDRNASRHADGAAAQGSGVKYGLNENKHQSYDRSEAAEATRQRLEEAAKAKAEADRAAAEARHQRRDYSTGRLTAEEKAARLAEMTGNATEHEQKRSSRLKHAADKEETAAEAEGDAGARHHSDSAKFMKTATKEIYGTVGEGTLEDRVTRRKFYIERGGADDRNAFRR